MLGVWKPTRPPDFPDHYFDFMHSVISKKRLPFLFWFRTRNVVFISEIFFQEITVLCEEIQSLRYKVFGRRYLWQHSKHPGEIYFSRTQSVCKGETCVNTVASNYFWRSCGCRHFFNGEFLLITRDVSVNSFIRFWQNLQRMQGLYIKVKTAYQPLVFKELEDFLIGNIFHCSLQGRLDYIKIEPEE
jgi:hypothetical protein